MQNIIKARRQSTLIYSNKIHYWSHKVLKAYKLAAGTVPLTGGTTRCWHQPEVAWVNPPPPENGITPPRLVMAA
jgi:hypothetical protein